MLASVRIILNEEGVRFHLKDSREHRNDWRLFCDSAAACLQAYESSQNHCIDLSACCHAMCVLLLLSRQIKIGACISFCRLEKIGKTGSIPGSILPRPTAVCVTCGQLNICQTFYCIVNFLYRLNFHSDNVVVVVVDFNLSCVIGRVYLRNG